MTGTILCYRGMEGVYLAKDWKLQRVVQFSLALSLFTISGGSARAHPSPRGLVEIDWPMKNIHRVLSAGYPASFGLYAFPHRELPRVEELEGRRCVVASFVAFDIDDDFAFDIDEGVEVELLFDRTTTRNVLFSYDRSGPAGAITRVVVPPEGAVRWHRETMKLERARFANRGIGGSDMAVVATGAMVSPKMDDPNTLTLCSVALKRSNATNVPTQFGRVDIRVLDGTSRATTPVRMGLYDATGRAPLPAEDALVLDYYESAVRDLQLPVTYRPGGPWPADNRSIFYVDGRYRARLPAGTYHMVVAKGIEYRVVGRQLAVAPDEETQLELELPRWDDMPERGWYSGDVHIHIARLESENERISAFLRAEDVHLSNLLEMNNPIKAHFRQYAWGDEGQFHSGSHFIVPGIEGPRTAQRGHTISLNIRAPVSERDEYFLYHRFFEEYARQGGLSGYAHVGSAEFNDSWGLALDVPFGIVDFVEILQNESLQTELWYEFLNLGYQLTPVAGSDFPYFSQPGAVRSYAHIEGEFSTRAWFDAVNAGDTFVTNGPLLALSANGEPMGSTLKLKRGDSIAIEAAARINPDIDRLDRMELIILGDVARTVTARDVESSSAIALRHELKAEHGLWLAVRAYGKNHALSHSAPVYVHVGDSRSWSEEKAPALVKKMRDRLELLAQTPISPWRELEFWEVQDEIGALWARQKPMILNRIAEANQKYDELLTRIGTGSSH